MTAEQIAAVLAEHGLAIEGGRCSCACGFELPSDYRGVRAHAEHQAAALLPLVDDGGASDADGGLACYDCGLPYGGPGWCDCHVPDDVWLRISPTGHEGGVLCISCIARRLVNSGIDGVPLRVTSGPWDFTDHGGASDAATVQAVER